MISVHVPDLGCTALAYVRVDAKRVAMMQCKRWKSTIYTLCPDVCMCSSVAGGINYMTCQRDVQMLGMDLHRTNRAVYETVASGAGSWRLPRPAARPPTPHSRACRRWTPARKKG